MDSFLFVIVLYNYELIKSESFKCIKASLVHNNSRAHLLVWDNSFQPLINADKISPPHPWYSISYIHSPSNEGLGVAYNYAADFAKKKGCEWIILLDQDTLFFKDFVAEAKIAIQKNPDIYLFVPMVRLKDNNFFSPFVVKHKRGHPKELTEGKYSLYKYSPINSGMIINVDAFLNTKGYNEKVRLDFADIQFIENFREKYSEFYLINSIAYQDFSNNEKNYDKLKQRFSLFCESARNCDKKNLKERMEYFYVVVRHMISLIYRTKNISFISIFKKNYLSK